MGSDSNAHTVLEKMGLCEENLAEEGCGCMRNGGRTGFGEAACARLCSQPTVPVVDRSSSEIARESVPTIVMSSPPPHATIVFVLRKAGIHARRILKLAQRARRVLQPRGEGRDAPAHRSPRPDVDVTQQMPQMWAVARVLAVLDGRRVEHDRPRPGTKAVALMPWHEGVIHRLVDELRVDARGKEDGDAPAEQRVEEGLA